MSQATTDSIGSATDGQGGPAKMPKALIEVQQRRAAITARMHAVTAKLKTVVERVRSLKRERDEARVCLEETVAARARLRQGYQREAASHEARKNELAAQLEAVRAEMAQLQAESKSLSLTGSNEHKQVKAQLRQAEQEKAVLVEQLRRASTENTGLKQEIERLQATAPRAVEQTDAVQEAPREPRPDVHRQAVAREQTRRVQQPRPPVTATDEQRQLSDAVSEAFGDIEAAWTRSAFPLPSHTIV